MMTTLLAVTAAIVAQGRQENSEGVWRNYTSKEGGFSILMPGKPTERSTTHPDSPEPSTVMSFKAGDTAFMATRIPNREPVPLSEADTVFRGIRQSATQGKLRAERRLTVGGFPALEITTESPSDSGPVLTRTRFILEGAAMYQVSVISPKAEAPAETERFLNSLRISKPESGSPREPAPPAGGEPIKPPAFDWQTVAPARAGFSVMMPGAPVEPPLTKDDLTLGHKPTYKAFAPTGRGALSVLYIDLDERDLKDGDDQALIRLRDEDLEIAKKANAKLVHDRKLLISGHTAREYNLESDGADGMKLRVQSILVGKRVYLLAAMGPKRDFPSVPAARFFSSFKLTPQKKP